MAQYILRRLVYSIPVFIIASILIFVVAHSTASPLGALRTNPRITPQDLLNYKRSLGLDKSGVVQYLTWLGHFLRLDWGRSLISQRAVGSEIREALANTLVLGLTATVFALCIGLTIGVFSAVRQHTAIDYAATGGAFFGLSIPPFWFGLILQVFFGLYLTRWFHMSTPFLPIAGMTEPGSAGFHLIDRVRHLILPVLTLSVQIIAIYSRFMRASMLEVMHSDYMRTARAKGVPERRVIVRHGMRNALIPVTTRLAIDVGTLAGGLVITESIFQWPGMGAFFINAINNGDYSEVLPWMMVVVFSVIAFNVLADISYSALDPRIRYA